MRIGEVLERAGQAEPAPGGSIGKAALTRPLLDRLAGETGDTVYLSARPIRKKE